MKTLSILLLFVAIFYGISARAEIPPVKKIDSLKFLLVKTISATEKVDILNQLSKLHRERGERKTSLAYAKRSISEADKLAYDKGKAAALLNLATTERELGNNDVALINLTELVKLSDKIGDVYGKGDAYDNMGHIFLSKNDKEMALKHHLIALDLRTKAKDDYGCGNSCDNIAAIYASQNNYLQAVEYYKRSLLFFEKLKEDSRVALSAGNVAFMWQTLGNYSEALKYNHVALLNYEKLGNDEGIIWINRVIGEIYSQTDDYKKALVYFGKSLKISEKLKRHYDVAAAYSSFGRYYSERNNFEEALKYYFRHLNLGAEMNDSVILVRANYTIASVKFKQNKLEEALTYAETSKNIATKISSENSFKFGSIGLMGRILLKQGNYRLAKEYTEQALGYHKLSAEKTHLAKDYKALADVNEKLGNYKLAFENYRLYTLYQDSLKQDDISKTVLRYEFDKKEKDFQTRNSFQQKLALLLGALVCVLLVAAILVYRTQRKTSKLNKLVSAQKKELESLGNVKDRIFSVVSHDMRSPVNSLISFINLLENGNVNEEKLKRYATSLKNSLGYTSAMMENLLNWAYSQMQGFKPNIVLLEVGGLVKEVVDTVSIEAAQKNVSIECTVPKDIHAMADANMLTLIIRNLLSNAVKFTDKGGNINLQLVTEHSNVVLKIADNGIGMSEGQMKSFNENASYQLGETTLGTNHEKGTGIGLNLCKTFAAIIDAELKVQSNVAEGATFTLKLALG